MIKRFGDERDWFLERRFGLFVHWGLYAIAAWHEQMQMRRAVPRKDYEKLITEFNPVKFDPDQWLDLAQEAGMEYMCFTTKHHDGFCLWDTAQTNYNVMNSPYGKDILAMLAEACHRRDFPLCLYYSVADWHHRNYPNKGQSHELSGPEPGDKPDISRYMEFLNAQIQELCKNYGEIHGIFWDMNQTGIKDTSINEMIRSLQPKAVINNRGFDDGDYGTPERDWDDYVNTDISFSRLTEANQSVGMESWGYKTDEDYYANRHLIKSVDKIIAKGGNYLLNVGPKADGTIPAESIRILRTVGKWYLNVKEAFDKTLPCSEITENRDVLLTRKENAIYVHLFSNPVGTRVLLKPLDTLPRKAVLLNTGDDVTVSVDILPTLYEENKAYLRIRNLPVNEFTDTVLIVKMEFDECVSESKIQSQE